MDSTPADRLHPTPAGFPAGAGSRVPVLPGGEPVITARLTPPRLPATFVGRRRLAARGDVPLVVVTGPAGAGKTLLAADWAATGVLGGTTAWLSPQPRDAAPEVFWTYVLEALRRHGVAPEGVDGPSLARGRAPASRLAAYLSLREEPVVLVIDAFDRVASPQTAAGLHALLRDAGGGLQLVLTSRTPPGLPLHRYRAAGELAEVTGRDLAFQAAETAALLARHGLPPTVEQARVLTSRTEGWAAGLRLWALAATRAADPAAVLDDVEAGHAAVADFLLAEVLDVQPAPVQDLLLRTSVLRRIHPALADALTGRDDAAPILGGLRRANAFVEAAGRSWYRCAPLFSGVLRARLRERHPGLEEELCRRAREWLRERSPGPSPPASGGDRDGREGRVTVVEPLSEREHDVLERVAELMSTEEIAADLFLSVNTVKTHLKSINRKLCASRRGEAVRRARRLKLL
ncbi:LuxR family transcriptional regulator [Nonomuraea pusilla]|uniref:LuxR family transcriptional regulator n=1 Tax=Nonomuraea pusilla TaxID=46177 RepID=UPI00128EDFB1|nr:LuxR family transcriptional regulator [Nonomuraea pusilla]